MTSLKLWRSLIQARLRQPGFTALSSTAPRSLIASPKKWDSTDIDNDVTEAAKTIADIWSGGFDFEARLRSDSNGLLEQRNCP